MASNHNYGQTRQGRDSHRSTSIDVLRSELENLAEEETPLPPRRPSAHSHHNDSVVNDSTATTHAATRVNGSHENDPVDGSTVAVKPQPRAASIDVAPRRSESGRVVFSDVLNHSREHRPQLRLDMGLYPIQSRVDDTEAAKKWRESRDQQDRRDEIGVGDGDGDGAGDGSIPTVAVKRGHRIEDEDGRPSRVSFVEPPSVTRPRHPRLQLGGVEDSIKRAAQANTTIAHAKDWVARKKSRARLLKRKRSFRFKILLGDWYQRWIMEGLLCQKPLPPSADGRHIPLDPGVARRRNGVGGSSSSGLTDERRAKPYISNFIRSSRYTLWSFLPAQLLFQFSKLANAYFLTISILQMTPGLSTTGTYTTFGPLMAFVAISMAKEGWDDYRRYKLDKLENRTEAYVLDPDGSIARDKQQGGLREKLRRTRQDAAGEMQELSGVVEQVQENPTWSEEEEVRWSKTQWQDIRVGDIIKLRRDENVPADMILLHATGPNGVAYTETMALDGETNLKSKVSCRLFMEHCGTLSALQACDAEIVSEDPNLDLYNYEGKAVVNGEVMPLTLNQVVYRGSILRNTSEVIGLVINTGEECKIRMNANKNVRAKAPAMQSKVNKIIILLVFFVVVLSLGCSIGNLIWVRDTERFAWYLDNYTLSFGRILVGFVIEFNSLIPLSLYVSLEIIKIGQVMLLRDIDMYDPVSNTPMVANTTTILENLGQVSYVFSDKTGTLTENIMRFRKMSVAGTAWVHDMDIQREAGSKRGRPAQSASQSARSTAAYNAGKGKQATRPSTSTMRSDCTHDPSVQQRQSMAASIAARSDFAASIQPDNDVDQGPPLFRTDDLLEYIHKRPDSGFSKKARQFILCIALCHTCLPEKKADGTVDFQAASPDELALVEAAQDLGILLIDRPAHTIKLRFTTNEHGFATAVDETYEVLDVIEFSSKRKRMSIVIRMPDGRICIFSKGADSVILPRLKQSKMAMETALAVDRQASIRKSMEQGKAMRKISLQSARNSTSVARATSNLGHRANLFGRRSIGRQSTSRNRPSHTADRIIAPPSTGFHDELIATSFKSRNSFHQQHFVYSSPRASVSHSRAMDPLQSPLSMNHDPLEAMVDEAVAISDSAVFERCFQHIDDFASEGLRTLLYAYRYVDEAEYNQWKTAYLAATTSLVDRQDRIEAAAEQIEQNLELAGATAIEDKLQQGVPETIDMLRRANIKVWMLTGDKRETAINIAHSARICKPFSEVYVLDATTEGLLQEKIAATLVDVGRGMLPHSVVVIDGHTLGVVDADPALQVLFFDLVARVDSVICCRASPAQKASLVQCIRSRVASSLTLAIGDGANDIAMIQASHVGIGISGREGLQAARISDYSIAQFRFLQRLLFVHGRWNYIRTGKYVLATFWKEVMFYLVQALYQRYNGYTGTSFYESTSLAVFNTLFTSLAVILLGIFEQDLRAETLLAMPELYTYGQDNKAFNFRKYIGWMIMAVLEAVLVFFGIWGVFSHLTFDFDNSLFAMGDLAFTAGVLFINIKLLVLELHNKTVVTFIGFFISVVGWFLWNLFLSAIYTKTPGPYAVRGAFIHGFGRTSTWWLTLIMVLAMVVVFELAVSALRRIYWPQDQDLVQEQEKVLGDDDDEVVLESIAEMGEYGVTHALNNSDGIDMVVDAAEEQESQEQGRRQTGRQPLGGAIKSLGFRARGHKRKASRNLSGDLYLAPPLVETSGVDDGAEMGVLSSTGAGVDAGGGNGKKRTVRTSTSEIRTGEPASAPSPGGGRLRDG